MKKFFEQKKSALVSGMSNNKGFSLVELIIVVAIMAVLMGVLAPQYLRFVESSREQTDVSAANEILKVLDIAIATLPNVPETETVTWLTTATGTPFMESTDADLKKEMEATLGTGGSSIGGAASTKYKDAAIIFTVGMDTNSVPFVYTADTDIAYALGIPIDDAGTLQTTDPSA